MLQGSRLMWAVFLCPDLAAIRYPHVPTGFTEGTPPSTLRSLPASECPFHWPSRSSLSAATPRFRVAWRSVWCHWMQLNEQVERCYLVRLPQPKEWRNGYHD
jgi:hypothetical protein